MNATLNEKLAALDVSLRDLKEIQPTTLEQFESDKMLRRYTERMLQMAVEQCIHIGVEILTETGLRAPENYHDIFIVLGEHGILSPMLVNSMTMMVELRNLLVYEYDLVDHMMVFSVLKRRLDDLTEFARAVHAFADGEPYVPSPLFESEMSE